MFFRDFGSRASTVDGSRGLVLANKVEDGAPEGREGGERVLKGTGTVAAGTC